MPAFLTAIQERVHEVESEQRVWRIDVLRDGAIRMAWALPFGKDAFTQCLRLDRSLDCHGRNDGFRCVIVPGSVVGR